MLARVSAGAECCRQQLTRVGSVLRPLPGAGQSLGLEHGGGGPGPGVCGARVPRPRPRPRPVLEAGVRGPGVLVVVRGLGRAGGGVQGRQRRVQLAGGAPATQV